MINGPGNGGDGAPVEAPAFYSSSEWVALVERLKVERFGSVEATRCEDLCCDTPGGRSGLVNGAHVVQLTDDPSLALEPHNVLFRCPQCHGRKTSF
jgi:5-methylcytosine-specific restriction enzyme A